MKTKNGSPRENLNELNLGYLRSQIQRGHYQTSIGFGSKRDKERSFV